MLPPVESPRTRPKVTVLCGFLGAGKTTLLSHLLKQRENQRWAAVVNDVAAIQVDGPTLKRTVEGLPVVELENGCVCCSSADDLGEAVAKLAMSEEFDHIWIETSGVALPQGVIHLFTRRNPFGRALNDFVELANVVSVVDTAQLLSEFERYGGETPRRELKPSSQRPVLELIIEQVEVCDVVVLNKSDLVIGQAEEKARGLVKGLNPRAEIFSCERGQLPVELFVDRSRFDPAATPRSAQWVRLLNEAGRLPDRSGVARTPVVVHSDRFGITTATFRARRPFRREAFSGWLGTQGRGILRAKGFCWLAEQPDEMIFLSIAASGVQLEPVAYWWASRVENGKARRADVPPAVDQLWEEANGDRRQELVFIGVGLDETALNKELAACFA